MNQPVLRSRQPSTALAPAEARSELEVQLEVAREMAKSDLLPAAYAMKPANVFIAINMGKALNLEPTQALYGMHVIDNRPTPSAKLQAALVRRAGHRLRVIENTHTSAVCEIVRADDPDYPVRVEYTMDDARQAGALDVFAQVWKQSSGGKRYPETWKFPEGLAWDAPPDELKRAGCPSSIADDKQMKRSRRDPWHTRPKVMLWHRAVTECVGAACPEVVAGIDIEATFEPDWSNAIEVDVVPTDPIDVLRQPDITARTESTGDGPTIHGEFIKAEPIEDIADAELEPEPAQTDGWTADTLKAALRSQGITQVTALRSTGCTSIDDLASKPELVDGLLFPVDESEPAKLDYADGSEPF